MMGTIIMKALGAALVTIAMSETIIASNFRSSRQAFYAAEAAAEVAIAELRTSANWIGIVEGSERSIFVDGPPAGPRALPADAPVDLTAVLNLANCSAPAPCGGVPRWQLFAYGPLRDLGTRRAPDSSFYVVVLVSGGHSASGEPLALLRAEAFGPRGARQAIEVTIVRTRAGGAVVQRTVFAQPH
jgi:hypothetical protein